MSSTDNTVGSMKDCLGQALACTDANTEPAGHGGPSSSMSATLSEQEGCGNRRSRQTKSQRDLEFKRLVCLVRYGCTLSAVRRILGINEKRVGMHCTQAAMTGTGMQSDGKCVVCAVQDIPDEIRCRFPSMDTDLLEFVFTEQHDPVASLRIRRAGSILDDAESEHLKAYEVE